MLSLIIYTIAFCYILRKYLKSGVGIFKGNDRLDGKTIIVTGGDSGMVQFYFSNI